MNRGRTLCKRHIITSSLEHSVTIKLCEHLAIRGYEITWLPVDSGGQFDPDDLESAITPETAVVSLLWANNETGVIFPVEEIAAITARKKVTLHLNAVQAAGKVPIDLETLGAQYVWLSATKEGEIEATRKTQGHQILSLHSDSGRCRKVTGIHSGRTATKAKT